VSRKKGPNHVSLLFRRSLKETSERLTSVNYSSVALIVSQRGQEPVSPINKESTDSELKKDVWNAVLVYHKIKKRGYDEGNNHPP